MIGGWRAWRKLIWLWAPAILAFVTMIAVFIWLTSGSVGREGQLQERLTELRSAIEHLENIRSNIEVDETRVTALESEMNHIYKDVFGNLDERLVDILTAIEDSTRGAGLLPGALGYSLKHNEKLGFARFGFSFAVSGRYEQIRQMISMLQSSPEFIIIESLSFKGEQEATTREIGINIDASTVLSSADPEAFRQFKAQRNSKDASDD